VSQEQGPESINAIDLLQANLSLLRAIGETLRQLVEELGGPIGSAAMARLRTLFLEALDTLLIQTGEVFTSLDAAAWDIFLCLVSDKAPAMDRLRGRYVHEQGELTPDEQWRLMRVTGLYERTTWLLRRLGEQQRRFLDALSETAVAMIRTDQTAPVPPLP
jgi:phosphate:Na+ symporter